MALVANYRKILLILVIYPVLSLGQNYLWPTNASHYLTSSFCEYRPGHYHSAIDIKTWNKEGYPCYAIENGRIYKVRVSPFGYGKVVYLKLNDGRMAVYAHLQKFSKEIDRAIRQQQLKQKRYTIQWNPKNLPVKKGEIIGYTGQTGIGVPHLHFEIRDEQEHPLNPLKFYKEVKDKVAPALQSLLIIPQTEDSKVNGSFLPKAFKVHHINNNIYIIKEPVKVNGKIGLAIKGYDKADDVYNKFAFYKTLLRVNNQNYFRIQYDKMDFASTNQVDIEIFYPICAETGEVYHKLYIDPYNKLPFYERDLGDGIIEINDKKIPFKIEISDYSGNISHVTGVLLANGVQPAKLQLMNKLNDLAFLQLELPSNLKELHFSSKSAEGQWKAINYFEILDRKFLTEKQSMLIKVKLNSSKDQLIKTLLTTTENETVAITAALNTQANQNIDFKVVNAGKFIVLQFNQIEDAADLQLEIAQNNKLQSIRPQIVNSFYEYVLPANCFTNSSIYIHLHARGKSYLDTSLVFSRLLPDQKHDLSFYNHYCTINTGTESLYDTLLLSVNKFPTDGRIYGVPVYSSIVELHTNKQILKKAATVKLHYDSLYSNPERMGLYSLGKNGSLSLIGATLDTVDQNFSGDVKNFGRFIIVADTVAPELNIIYPRDNQQLKQLSKIQFAAKDAHSGIGSDRNLSITVDGEFVLPEWDPERDLITGYLDTKLESGEHEVIVQVRDVAGNISKEIIRITIL